MRRGELAGLTWRCLDLKALASPSSSNSFQPVAGSASAPRSRRAHNGRSRLTRTQSTRSAPVRLRGSSATSQARPTSTRISSSPTSSVAQFTRSGSPSHSGSSARALAFRPEPCTSSGTQLQHSRSPRRSGSHRRRATRRQPEHRALDLCALASELRRAGGRAGGGAPCGHEQSLTTPQCSCERISEALVRWSRAA
jgi:hypothetical protein